MYQRPSAPLSIGGVLDHGFRLLRASFTKVIALAAAGALAGNLASILSSGLTPEEVAAQADRLVIAYLISLPASVFMSGAIVARIMSVANSAPISAGEALGIGARRFIPLLISAVV